MGINFSVQMNGLYTLQTEHRMIPTCLMHGISSRNHNKPNNPLQLSVQLYNHQNPYFQLCFTLETSSCLRMAKLLKGFFQATSIAGTTTKFKNWGFTGSPSDLVMTNSSPWYRWPIEIDGLPIIFEW